MNFANQIIFFFSALGAFNGFLLSLYFALVAKKRKFSNYFLAFLLLVLSIRIIKSVFFYFNRDLSNIFIQIGLSACTLIGQFLFLYIYLRITVTLNYTDLLASSLRVVMYNKRHSTNITHRANHH